MTIILALGMTISASAMDGGTKGGDNWPDEQQTQQTQQTWDDEQDTLPVDEEEEDEDKGLSDIVLVAIVTALSGLGIALINRKKK